MKKTLMTFIGVCALAMTASAASEISNWFNGEIGSDWPFAVGMNGEWSNTNGVEFIADDPGYLAFEADDAAPLTFTATEPKELELGNADRYVDMFAEMEFDPVDELPVPSATAKGGVTVLNDGDSYEFYVLAKDENASSNVWTATGVSYTPETKVTVKCEFFSESSTYYVWYTIGEQSLYPYEIATDGTMSTAKLSGSGKLYDLYASATGYDEPVVDDWPDDPTGYEGVPAGEKYDNIPLALADVDAWALAAWATSHGVDFSVQDEILPNAFLLDCDNTDQAIEEEQADFKLSISIVDGVVSIDPEDGDPYKNGKVELQGRASLTEGDWSDYDSATHKFIRAILVPAEITVE